MPTVTQILEQRRRKNRRNVYLDGKFAFGCNVNVVAKFRLREGLELSADEVAAIQQGEVRQEVFDKAMSYLQRRQHARRELATKLKRLEYPGDLIEAVLDDLERLGYVNDERFAADRAASAAGFKKLGRNRAMTELMRSGVSNTTARQAVEAVYETTDTAAVARELAEKKAPSLRRLDALTARRRLYGLLLRRGFEYDVIKPVVEEVLGRDEDD